ncbi:MAG: 2-oxoglutarate dehydrogenase complex dihydrolipoyllysine-residue succinyltransferase [Bacteroidales bacterium]|nr:2-oxoglutarate dehydrogenase complex dihydrolipoyllysine-residue succinyltransferase [Bacteroidales bacterium]
MIIEIKVPSPGESISQVQLAAWLVADGEYVEKDAEIAEIDSDKATLSISAEASGKIKLLVDEGDTIDVGSVAASIDTEAVAPEGALATAVTPPVSIKKEEIETKKKKTPSAESKKTIQEELMHYSPLARKIMQAEGIPAAELEGFYKHLRVTKDDIDFFKENKSNNLNIAKSESSEAYSWGGTRDVDHKQMSPLRKKLAQRLVSVKNETAMLTTFNEVNMTPIMELRKKYKETFKEQHGVGLGFMSFFTKAVTEALKHFPAVNAQIEGDEILYHDYADIGIAVSAPKGLVVPVLRNAERMSLSDIETNIKELAERARKNRITLDEMTGGTFTITNGGVFGSMLSTPIINPPQSAILGMHNIVERPIAINGKVEIHPIMYVALSYDHRVIDGRESVGFLVKVKEMLENPVKMLFGGDDPVKALLGI